MPNLQMSDKACWKVELFDMADPHFLGDWETLSNSYHANNRLLSTEFLATLLHYFGHNPLYQVRAIWQGKVQCLMLLRQRDKLIWELYKPSQAQVGLMLINPAFKPDVKELLRSLPGMAARIDFLSLDQAEHLAFLSTLKDHQRTFYATNMQIKLEGSFKDYWQQRSKNLRKNMSRYENRLQRENTTLNFHQIINPQDILSAVDRYGMLESKGWKGKLGTALHPSNQQGQFYRDFLYRLAQQNTAVVYEYFIKDRLVASRLCCIKGDMLIILKTTFDEEFKNFSLGRLLLKQILNTLFENNTVKVIDFYTNASPEQLEWATDTREIYNSSVYAENIFGKVFKLLIQLKQILKKKSLPTITEAGE